jgi:hypothetical protein
MKKALAAIAVAGLASLPGTVPAQAKAVHNGCPRSFTRTSVTDLPSTIDPQAVDHNDNGFVCVKHTQGRGNTGMGFSIKDDNSGSRR